MKYSNCKCYLKEQIMDICKNEYLYFFNLCNVIGVGYGYKIKNGVYTNEPCINVFVIQKIPSYRLSTNNIIPSYYKGIQTDVIQSGIPKITSFTNRIRPVPGGYSVGDLLGAQGGTMACLVTDGKYYHVLSNNHVLAAEGLAPIGNGIVQPAINDGGNPNSDVIAHLTKFIDLKYNTHIHKPENIVDCAMGKIDKRSQVSSKIAMVGRVKGTRTAIIGQDVMKVGRTTELTKGKIINIGVTTNVQFARGFCLFKDCIVTTKMTEHGDSGALLLDNDKNAIGLNFSNTLTQSIYNPIEDVLKSLNVKIVTGN